MRRKTVSGIMLALLLIGMLILAFNIQPVEASGTIYIRADGSVDPDTAPISSVDNVTYTFTDNIYDSIVVERDNIVVDGASYSVQGTGSGTGITLSDRSNVTIKNLQIKSFEYGINLSKSSNNTISGNNITSNYHLGVYLSHSNSSTISNNTIRNNGYGVYIAHSENNTIGGNTIINIPGASVGGIRLAVSDRNTIINNTISNNYYEGILLAYSSGNILRFNEMTSNGINFEVYGTSLSHYIHDIDPSNKVDNKPIYYLVNQYNKQIPSDAGYVAAVNSTSITVKNANLKKNAGGVLFVYSTDSTVENVSALNNGWYGIRLYYSDRITIIRSTISNNYQGIRLDHSSGNVINGSIIASNWAENGVSLNYSYNNVITDNNITSNNHLGIGLTHSDGNTITENVVSDNSDGIDLRRSRSNIISCNVIASNQHYGIYLRSSDNNTIFENTLSNNCFHLEGSHGNVISNNAMTSLTAAGPCISLGTSTNNVISGNTASNNKYGIWIGWSSGNAIYHNNFIDNIYQVYSFDSINTWDNGYPSGGNYWSDYTGVDVKSGPNQDQPSSDGIGDTPYIINGTNIDHYPLMYPWGSPPPPSYTLTIYSSPPGVTFTVDGVSRTAPWSGTYSEGASVSLVMPETHGVYYDWSHWQEDGDPNRIKTVTMDTDITLTAVYTPPPGVGGKAVPIDKPIVKPELQIPWIWLTTIILPLVATALYVKFKKKKH